MRNTEITPITRRTVLLGMGGIALAGCLEGAPPVLNISAQAQAGMNPGPDGSDRPVTLTVIQMAGTGAFDGADYIALQDPQAALGGEFVRADRIVLAPGGSASKAVTIQPGTTAVGVVGGFRSPGGKTVRQKIPAPGSSSGLMITVGPGGLLLGTA